MSVSLQCIQAYECGLNALSVVSRWHRNLSALLRLSLLSVKRAPFALSSLVNLPGESTLRREFLRLQQETHSQTQLLQQQLQHQDNYKRQLLADRQKRIEQQQEERRRFEEVWFFIYHFKWILNHKRALNLLRRLVTANTWYIIHMLRWAYKWCCCSSSHSKQM